MRNMTIAVAMAFLVAGCSDSPDSDTWYKGGTLHNTTVEQWKEGTTKDKLATLADLLAFMDKDLKDDSMRTPENMKPLYKNTKRMVQCVDEKADEASTAAAARPMRFIALRCLLELGIKKLNR